MPVIRNQFRIDADQAISTVTKVQDRFLNYNNALGQVIGQTAVFNRGSKDSIQVLTQIDSEGRKAVSTVRQVGQSYETLSVKTGQASKAQRQLAADLKQQAELADKVARQIKGIGARRSGAPVTTGIAQSLGPGVSGVANITEAQARASARDNRLSVPQTNAFVKLIQDAAKVRDAIGAVSGTYDKFVAKLNEAGKIAFATAIYRGISLISGALKDGVSTAVSYTNQIGLIQTISQDSGESFDSWNAAIRRTADSLGVSTTRVAKDAYDALSNQVIKTSKDFALLETAIRLEQVTGSSAGTGLNVLSSLINGMGTSANQAGLLADKLFAIVDIGKVKLEGLDKVLGRTTSLMKTAGSNFDETAGALAFLTQTGIDEQESSTLLNNIFSELIKPNKELSEELRKMGFNTGFAAVQTLTLAGLLDELSKKSAGTKDGLATYFPDIRGLRGVAVLTQNLDGLKKSIEGVKKAQGATSNASSIVNANPGQQLLQEQERLKNFFTNDIGVKAVEAAAKLTSALGGVQNILANVVPIVTKVGGAIVIAFAVGKVANLIKGIVGVAGAFGGVRSAIDLATAAQLTFQRITLAAAATTTAFIAAFAAGYLAAEFAVEKLQNTYKNLVRQLNIPIDIKVKSDFDKIDSSSSKRVADFEYATAAMTARYGVFISHARRLNDQFAADAKVAFEKAARALSQSFDVALIYARKIAGSIEDTEAKVTRNLEKIDKESYKIREDFAAASFDRRIADLEKYGQEEIQAAQKYNSEVDQANQQGGRYSYREANVGQFGEAIASEAQARINALRDQINSALKSDDLERAEASYREIGKVLDQVKSAKEGLGYKGVNVDDEHYQQLIGYEAKLAEYRDRRKADEIQLEQNSLKARTTLKELEGTYKEIEDLKDKVYDKKTGNLSEEYAKQPRKAITEFDALNKKAEELQKTMLSLGGDESNQNKAARLFGNISEDAAAYRSALTKRIAASLNEDTLTRAGETRKTLAENEIKLYTELETQTSKVNKNIIESAANILKYGGALKSLLNSNNQNDNVVKGIFGQKDHANDDVNNKKIDRMMQLARDPDIGDSKKKANELQQLTRELQNSMDKLKDNEITNALKPEGDFSTVGETLKNIVNQAEGLRGSVTDLKDLSTEMKNFKDVVSSTDTKGIDNIKGTIDSIINSIEGIDDATRATQDEADATYNLTKQIQYEAAALEKLNAIRANAPLSKGSAGSGGAVEGHASGGIAGSQGGFLAAFFGGKFAKGTDIIPAMLTRDEFVVRAPMARKFYSQLIAINSNQAPIYRSEGGSTTSNVNTSNYHIHVNSGDSGGANQMARTVTQAIRRAQAQGVIS